MIKDTVGDKKIGRNFNIIMEILNETTFYFEFVFLYQKNKWRYWSKSIDTYMR